MGKQHFSFTTGDTTEFVLPNQQKISIELFPDVFPPSHWAQLFINYIKIDDDCSFLDVGTGSGVLAIAAKMQGAGDVFAPDVSYESVCAGFRNMERNNMRDILFFQINSFEALNSIPKFDVIVANLPQEIVPQDFRGVVGEKMFNTFYAGESFDKSPMKKFLDKVSVCMHRKTRLYIMVHTLGFYRELLAYVEDNFKVRRLGEERSEIKEFVDLYPDFYEEAVKDETALMYQENGQWYAMSYVLQIRKK